MKPPPSPFLSEDTLPPATAEGTLPHRAIAVDDVGGATAKGRRRKRNEDAWGHRNGRVIVVADGMGGRPNGDIAAQAAVDGLLRSLGDDITDWRTPVTAANQIVSEATHDQDHDHARAENEPSGGAVAVALRCVDDRISVLHIGDARAYRIRDGVAEPLTRDHSVAETMAELGVRRSTAGLDARQLSSVTSFLGEDGSADEFTVRELTVRPGDRIVLCTDGCYSALTVEAWQRAGDIERAGDAASFLVETAVGSGARDDATAVVVDLVNSEAHRSGQGAV